MSDDSREMHVNSEHSPRKCPKCGMVKMTIEGRMKCPNCDVQHEKTGQTIIVTEPKGENGPVKITLVTPEAIEAQRILELRKKIEGEVGIAQAEVAKVAEPTRAGTVLVHVPTSLFPDLVMWARKLKLPKDWKEAEKIKAITDFQIEINSKLGGLQ